MCYRSVFTLEVNLSDSVTAGLPRESDPILLLGQ